jgi:oxygen-independent coproporphyrinogen-3 oxidase
VPDRRAIAAELEDIPSIGLYLHIPFCNRICPYCPYNKEIFREESCIQYLDAIKTEIDLYADIMGNIPVTSFYIGGGTPTTMLDYGLVDLLNHVYKRFRMNCHIHMESHPNHLSKANLKRIKQLGVQYLSLGVEALQDHHLQILKRNYTVASAKQSLRNAMEVGFECVNMDYMFDLPGQTAEEVEDAAKQIVELNVDQVATYPLFNFEYAHINRAYQAKRGAITTMFRRRQLLKILEDHFYRANYYRSSVWAFTKEGIDKYCSVTIPRYLGIGASGSSYLNSFFYVNTFRVKDYVAALREKRMPISVSTKLTSDKQKLGWLYWRIYETCISKNDFLLRFGESFDQAFGKYMRLLARIGFLETDERMIKLTDRGTYWIHAFEDFFSINYINKLWGRMRKEPWPESIVM